MHWRKLGKIFDPTQHTLPAGCKEFAQSPQALVFDDFVRIFFSTRSRDLANGKFLSHVACVDFRKNLRDIIRVVPEPVIALGELGCFDEHGIFPLNVMRHGDLVYGYTCGWSRRVSVSVDTAIGLAISRDDGLSFDRIGRLARSWPPLREPCLVGDAFVKVIEGVFHMWYIFGTGWKVYSPAPRPIALTRSDTRSPPTASPGPRRKRRQIIADRLGEAESQALPTVIKIDDHWHMFFCYRESFDFRKNSVRGYRIGHACSDDLQTWVRDDEHPLS